MLEMSERDCSASNVKGIQMHRDNNRCDYYSSTVLLLPQLGLCEICISKR